MSIMSQWWTNGTEFHLFWSGEEKEFQEAMRAEVGTTSLCTTNSSKNKFLQVFTGADIITPVYKNGRAKILN